MRDLSHGAAELFDQVERDGRVIVVTRFGRPSAMIVPFKDEPITAPTVDADAASEHRKGDLALYATLNETEIAILHSMAASPNGWEAEEWLMGQPLLTARDVFRAISTLDLSGLMGQRKGRTVLSEAGARLLTNVQSLPSA